MFKLDARLLGDCELLGKFKLCHVLLMRDANYPWCILVPAGEGLVEVFDLSEKDQQQLKLESNTLLHYLRNEFNADKMNVAALGNIVSQLHIHHVVRYKNDISWPSPVWGAYPIKNYAEDELQKIVIRLQQGFSDLNLNFKIT